MILLKYIYLNLLETYKLSKKADFTLQTLALIILAVIGFILFALIIGGQVASVQELFSYD